MKFFYFSTLALSFAAAAWGVTTPTSLVVVPTSSSGATLSWLGSSDAVGYNVLRNGIQVATVSSAGYQDAALQPLTVYSYSVIAFDGNGSVSSQSAVVPLSTPPAGFALSFDDEFSGTTLDTSKWIAAWPWGNGLNNTYPNDEAVPGNITVSNGSGHFALTQGGTPSGAPYASAVASTSGKFSQQTGYWESRLKLPANSHGIWPAFWLVATDGTWPPEIDIMEWLGNTPNENDMTVHWGSNNQTAEGIYRGADLSADFHIYGFLWTSSDLTFYMDGVKQFSTTQGIPTKPLQIIMNNSTGGWNNNVVDGSTVFPAVMEVDYVRVFTSNGTVVIPPTTNPGADTTAPSTPTGLTGQYSGGAVSLSWSASKDDVGVAGYNIYRGGALIGTSTQTSYQDSQVSSGSTYAYTVAAYDAAGNVSPQSSSVSVTTTSNSGTDTTAPSAPTGLSGRYSGSTITLSWSSSTDDVGVTGYNIYRGGALIGTAPQNKYQDTQVSAGSTYSYTVAAYDAAGNTSSQSSSVSVTTSTSSGRRRRR